MSVCAEVVANRIRQSAKVVMLRRIAFIECERRFGESHLKIRIPTAHVLGQKFCISKPVAVDFASQKILFAKGNKGNVG